MVTRPANFPLVGPAFNTLLLRRADEKRLPDSYTYKPDSIPAYFDAMLDATPPERFSVKFLENLGFTSTNDRLFIGILKDLGFLNRDGTPQPRYFQFLDRARAKQAVAEGIRDAFADLFAVNTKAQDLPLEEVKIDSGRCTQERRAIW